MSEIVQRFLEEHELVEHDLQQGTPEWDGLRLNHDGASEAADMMNLRGNTSRAKILRMKALGLTKEFSQFVRERVLDPGHVKEALARPIIEKKIGRSLYPVTCSRGRMLSSSDGKTAAGDLLWEHKQYNEELFASVQDGILPDEHWPQCHQGLLVHSAEKLLFTVSDGTEERMASMEVFPDPEKFERLILGWEQFHKDRENYQHNPVKEMPQADVSITLPVLSVSARGEIVESNLKQYGEALTVALANTRAIALITDQDFSNAKEAAKLFRQQAKDIVATKGKMLSQSATIAEAAAMMDAWAVDLNKTALQLEKDVEREDLAKKAAMIDAAKLAFHAHIEALEAETRPIQLNICKPDFAAAIKNKRSYQNMQDAIDGVLANGKADADCIAKDVRAKLAWCKEHAAGHSALFPDLQQIIVKPMDDFTLLISSRIEKAKADEAAKLEAERARIQAEEEAKARAKVVQEEARILAEKVEKAKAENDARIDEMVAKKRAEIESSSVTGLTKPSRPTDDQIIDALSLHYRVHESKVIEWLMDMDLNAASDRMAKEFA